jgi:hypothetical protein
VPTPAHDNISKKMTQEDFKPGFGLKHELKNARKMKEEKAY